MIASIVLLIDFVLRELMFSCSHDPSRTWRLGKTMFLVSICRLGILEPAVELKRLRYFVAVAEMENVSRFGDRLKCLHLSSEPIPISIDITQPNRPLNAAAEQVQQ